MLPERVQQSMLCHTLNPCLKRACGHQFVNRIQGRIGAPIGLAKQVDQQEFRLVRSSQRKPLEIVDAEYLYQWKIQQ
ncbi:hypothetical protein [Mycobacterium leprae]|uniref:hypothetical protein n=1 Tax=Mycobacterium leprae TaxID=1769 RepID=UPI000B287EAC|nr:hypothetical protein [Mycobacterium leprae]